MSGLTLSLRSKPRRRAVPFVPSQVAAVAAGYFWDPAAGSGSGGAGFLIPEGNGNTAFNMITPSAGVAPSLSTINGRPVAVYTNGTPDKCARASGNVQRGFTGATMIWGWISAPGPNVGIVLGHTRAIHQWNIHLTTADVRLAMHDGVGSHLSRFPLPPGGYAAGPFYYEGIFDPSQTTTNRLQLFIDRVQQTPISAGSPGTTMQDTADVLGFSASTGDSSNFNLNGNATVGVMGMTSGLPSDAERDLLFAYRKLK